MRAVIFANGLLNDPQAARAALQPDDVLIAADGGARHCVGLGLTPAVVIGDFDSLTPAELTDLEAAGAQLIRYPMRKDFTDLELALDYAVSSGAAEIVVLAALGARWDQTLANLLLPAAVAFRAACIRLIDGAQEMALARPGEGLHLSGVPGDTVSLIPLGGDAHGVTTEGLEYPLENGVLRFGATRGVSNVLLGSNARVNLRTGLLLVVHHRSPLAAL